MANFEGKLNLNVETSEIEIKGKFKLTEEELDTVTGGAEVQSWWKVVQPKDSCESGERKEETGQQLLITSTTPGGTHETNPIICATCKHHLITAGIHYCTLED